MIPSVSLRQAQGLILLGLSLILIGTLHPFNFSVSASLSFSFLVESFRWSAKTSFSDFIANILLFIPFGFALALYLYLHQFQRGLSLLIIAFFSCFISSSVEILQTFLPSRQPTLTDIIFNTISGCGGYFCFGLYFQKYTQINPFQLPLLIRQRLPFFTALLLSAYTVTVMILLTLSPQWMQLKNWNPDFPLILGNEATADRPWAGSISQFCWYDQRLSKAEIEKLMAGDCLQTFEGQSMIYPLGDLSLEQEGNLSLPPLAWQGETSQGMSELGVSLNEQSWLKTATAATTLNEQLRRTSQFTLRATITTHRLTQTGPARIISLSRNAYERNFTLGQQEMALNLRVRSPLTGDNGKNLNFTIPDSFTDTLSHNFIITYNRLILNIYRDDSHPFYQIYLTPDSLLFWSLMPMIVEFNPQWQWLYFIGYRSLIFIPFGFLLLLFIQSHPILRSHRKLCLGLGAIAGSLGLELLSLTLTSESFSILLLLVSIILCFFPFFVQGLQKNFS